jgi:riboflavin kinase/FMN adenylyltransferase
MRRLAGLEDLRGNTPWPVVTLGTFDGVHLGHQRLLSEVVGWARANAGTAVVVTFEQPPKAVLTSENPPLITSLGHRLMLLERAGVDVCVVLEFTQELAATTAREFVRAVLVDRLRARGLVVGHGAAFGHAREGNEEFLRKCAGEFGFEVRVIPPVVVDGEAVSSSRIRGAVLQGDFEQATGLLGRPFSVLGTVARGDGRGRELGFPTANLELEPSIVPPDGVYVARGVVDERAIPAVASIGTRPTFAEERAGEGTERVVEIYLMGFDREIYGRKMEAEFLKRLRGQAKYATVAELVAQMKVDVARAREYFADMKVPPRRESGKTP